MQKCVMPCCAVPSDNLDPWTQLAEAVADQLVKLENFSPSIFVQEIEMLWEMGLDVNYRPNNSATILYFMIANNLVEGVKKCLAWQASVDNVDDQGRTAIQVATENQCSEILDLLEQNVTGKLSKISLSANTRHQVFGISI